MSRPLRTAGSTATRSCGSGYLDGAANCHDVADLTDIHSKASITIDGTTYTSCLVCHRDDALPPSSVNCQSAGCHPGVNGATHVSTYHETTFASDAAGPFAGQVGQLAAVHVPVKPRRGTILISEAVGPMVNGSMLCAQYIAAKHLAAVGSGNVPPYGMTPPCAAWPWSISRKG